MPIPLLRDLEALAELFDLEILQNDAGAYWGGIPWILVKDKQGNIAKIFLTEKGEFISTNNLPDVPMTKTKQPDKYIILI